MVSVGFEASKASSSSAAVAVSVEAEGSAGVVSVGAAEFAAAALLVAGVEREGRRW